MTEKMTRLDKAKARAEALAKAAKEAKQKAARLEAHARTAKAAAERTRDTKRKILLGAFVLSHKSEIAQSQEFIAWLTRDEDKALFNQD